jgi:CRISPR-associated protein Cas2
MSATDRANWLITYDISDKKRLQRVFRLLKKHGIPIQYSVFSITANANEVRSLIAQLATLINAREDDIRAYQLPTNPWQITLGAAILPDGILLTP